MDLSFPVFFHAIKEKDSKDYSQGETHKWILLVLSP